MPKGTTTVEPGVQRTAEGKYWVRASCRHPRTGKMVSRSATLPAGSSLHDARKRLAELRLELDGQVLGAPSTRPRKRPTVSDCAERWLQAQAARVRRSTAEHYVQVLSRHVLPVPIGPDGAPFGELFTDTVSRADVDRWCRWAEHATREDGGLYAKETVAGWWRVICAFLRDTAAELGLADPIVRVKGPRIVGRPKRREQRTLSKRDLARLVAAVEPARHAEAYVMAYTGMRPGELYALEWRDVDEAAGVIRVRRAHRRGWLDAVKTDDPRDLALTDGLLGVLRAHRARTARVEGGEVGLPPALLRVLAKKDRLTNADVRRELGYSDSKARKALRRWVEAGLLVRRGAKTRPHYRFGTGRVAVEALPRTPERPLVFPSRTGTFREPAALNEALGRAAESLGIELRVGCQVLRRTFNTLMLRAGVDRVVLRAQMGHCSEEMTERYAGVPVEAKREAVTLIEQPEDEEA